ncbi:ABC transporter permease [uncultured Psychroserpens sp.]|uniref:ABC transporter permease n=1 Tax=uncultured Psychroserpens sp. TaxID=255436 RepID=UPI00262C4ADE|nr:ABC transporter permease [uncultured Psychroserpens sp.]
MALETKIYQKENNKSIFKLLGESLKDTYQSLFLARQLAVRDIKAQYRQSYLGILWAFITPLTTALVWIFLNSSGTIKLTDTGISYAFYAFSGALIWSILTEALKSPITSTVAAKSIMSKINFPKEALIVSGIFKMLFNTAIKVIILVVFLFVFKIELSWSLAFFPLVILGLAIFATTIGLFITPLGLLYKDVSKAIPIILQLLMYMTPVVYAIPKTGIMKTIMEANPLTPLVLNARNVFVGLELQFVEYSLWVIGISVPLFFISLVFYRVSIPIIVERMSA